jgi:hypothetical protein
MVGQVVFAVASLVVFVLWQLIKPGKSIFDK